MSTPDALSPTDFHVLLVLSNRSLYGYAIKQALAEESGGSVDPEIGSLYRVIARLVSTGLVERVAPDDPGADEVHPGRRRKYYALTPVGERALRDEATRMHRALGLARDRGLLHEGGS